MIAATQLRVGNLIMYNGKPWRVASMVHRTPGNLRGFVQARLVSIDNGSNTEVRFSSEEIHQAGAFAAQHGASHTGEIDGGAGAGGRPSRPLSAVPVSAPARREKRE